MVSKGQRYQSLVAETQNCSACDFANTCKEIYLEKSNDCAGEINLWSYWEGGINHLDANILLVGQDWGSIQDKNLQRAILNVRKKISGERCNYTDNSFNLTDSNLARLFRQLNYQIDSDYGLSSNLFFTNFVLCYRNKGCSGNFNNQWIHNCSYYFLQLVEIIEPKVILCLGQRVFNSILTVFHEAVPKGNYNPIIENGTGEKIYTVNYSSGQARVFPLAHCGGLGTRNRNYHLPKQKDKLAYQEQDWGKVAAYLQSIGELHDLKQLS